MPSSTTRRHSGSNDKSTTAAFLAVVGIVAVLALFYGSWRVGRWFTGITEPAPKNPINAALRVASGELRWPLASTITLIVVVILLGSAAAVGAALWTKHRPDPRTREFDRNARYLATASELTGVVMGREAKQTAARLRPTAQITTAADVGLSVGALATAPQRELLLSWEWCALVVAGPRTGKTHALAIPMICQAPGPVFSTTNKSDLHDHTRYVRADRGTVWCSDLQHIAGSLEQTRMDSTGLVQSWWWNPLRNVEHLRDARTVAGYFKSASTESGARVDSYFDGGAQELLALYMFAAAAAGGDLLHVYGWLSDPTLETPIDALLAAGHSSAASQVLTAQNLNPRQRDGLYDMARRFVNVMSDPSYAASVLPPRRTILAGDNSLGNADITHNGVEFIPDEFVLSTDTVYAMSMEGPAAATALTTALAGCVFEAAVKAARANNGRLAVPLVGILDEAANVCKLQELPGWYSHFGGQGICLVTILQSLAQADRVWSAKQLQELLGAANLHYYGGGSNDMDYLRQVSDRIGHRDVRRQSRSHSQGHTSYSENFSKEPVLTPDALAQMPTGRAIAMFGTYPAALVRKQYWWDGPLKESIEASKARCRLERTAGGQEPLETAA